MSSDETTFLRRASIDGALCTIRCHIAEGQIPNTRGAWLGVEWDDPTRGKHDGTLHGRRYFRCQSQSPTVASFIKASRKFDEERTVLKAIRYKYGGDGLNGIHSRDDLVVISGKVAQEIGFEKIAREQATLDGLKIVVLEKLVVYGLAPRGASAEEVKSAQTELAITCPNIVELDLGYNVIETWNQVYDICATLPKLRLLRLNGIRFRLPFGDLDGSSQTGFPNMRELHLNECLLKPDDAIQILHQGSVQSFPNLTKLWLSQNEIDSFEPSRSLAIFRQESIQELILENNLFTNLDSLDSIMSVFPHLKHLSLQGNRVQTITTHTGLNDRVPVRQQPGLESLSVSLNNITSFEFVDTLSVVLPNLSSLRISKNPLYDAPQSVLPNTTNPLEANYYLTLARVPALKMLNYTQITPREREEGEIYYLSIAERAMKEKIASINRDDPDAKSSLTDFVRSTYPRYEHLCQQHDRESVLLKIFSPSSKALDQILEEGSKPKYPPGSIAANLVRTQFYVQRHDSETKAVGATTNGSTAETNEILNKAISRNIPTSQIFALVARRFNLAPLQFRMVYESAEFDPVQEDYSTKSQIYTSTKPSDLSGSLSAAERYKSWGDWDADAIVEASRSKLSQTISPLTPNDNGHETETELELPAGTGPTSTSTSESGAGGKWTAEGFLLKDGKRWRRREVEILTGLRSWGDWVDEAVGDVTVRVEPFLARSSRRK